MTLDELVTSEKVMLTPADVGSLLGMHPQTINLKAKNGTLPFRYIRSGSRTKIPRLALMEWLGVKPAEKGGE